MKNKLIIAHRGYHQQFEENTIPAFIKAIEIGFDMIELDVRKTQDNILIVYHNPSINGQLINNLTYKQINSLVNGFSIPTFEEVLQATQGKIKLFIEIKDKGYEHQLVKLTLQYFQPTDFIIISFKIETLRIIQKYYPQLQIGLLVSVNESPRILFLYKTLGWKVTQKIIGLKTNILLPNYQLLLSNSIKLHSQQSIFVWTVNQERELQLFLENQLIKGIITDDLPLNYFN